MAQVFVRRSVPVAMSVAVFIIVVAATTTVAFPTGSLIDNSPNFHQIQSHDFSNDMGAQVGIGSFFRIILSKIMKLKKKGVNYFNKQKLTKKPKKESRKKRRKKKKELLKKKAKKQKEEKKKNKIKSTTMKPEVEEKKQEPPNPMLPQRPEFPSLPDPIQQDDSDKNDDNDSSEDEDPKNAKKGNVMASLNGILPVYGMQLLQLPQSQLVVESGLKKERSKRMITFKINNVMKPREGNESYFSLLRKPSFPTFHVEIKTTPAPEHHAKKPSLVPEQTDNREKPGQTDNREKPGQTDNREKPGQTDNREKPGQTDNREKPGQTDNRQKPGQANTSDHSKPVTTAKPKATITKRPDLETTTHDRSIITAPIKQMCPEGQRMGPDRTCRNSYIDPETGSD